MTRWDVVVVGAGPAGSIAAHALATAGATVLLLDRETFPRRKVCGSCLSEGAVSVLSDAGLHGIAGRARASRLTRLVLSCGRRRVTVPLAGGGVFERAELDTRLTEEAVAAGATFRDGTFASLEPPAIDSPTLRARSAGGEERLTASYVLDATGLLGLPGDGAATRSRVHARSRIGLGATVDAPGLRPGPGELLMAIAPHGYVGLVRLPDGRVNVGAAVDAARLRRLGPAGSVGSILVGAGVAEIAAPVASATWRGTPALTRRPASPARERVLRLGDACGYVEPFTGEGICWALDSGLFAGRETARAVDDGRPDRLARTWRAYGRRSLGPARCLCRLMAAGLRRPAVVSVAMTLLAVAPVLAHPFVSAAARRPRPRLLGTP